MHIRSPGTHASTPAQASSSADRTRVKGGAKFEKLLAGTENVSVAAPVSDLMQELKTLAADVKSGKTTKEEASRLFVGMVIDKRINLSQFTANTKKIENAVADMVEQDPHFVARLEGQLKKIAGDA